MPTKEPVKTGFIDALQCEYEDGRRWTVLKPFSYVSAKTGLHIIVPIGFSTDFASIPRVMWRVIFPTDDIIAKAAVIHDFLYRTPTFPISRLEADNILIEGMELLGAGLFKRRLVHAGVRVGGGKAYRTRVTSEESFNGS
jgi:hypothetical protein